MRTALFSMVLVSAAPLLASAGCAETQKPLQMAMDAQGAGGPATLAMPGPGAAARPNGLDTASPTAGSIRIDERILRACGNLPMAHFAFDSAKISGDAEEVLARLAECFVAGPLAGHSLSLVGHADPRGEVIYNIALGQQRAGSVATFLAKRGVAERRMGTMSKGEMEASGYDEEGWARDRKVEVFLADADLGE